MKRYLIYNLSVTSILALLCSSALAAGGNSTTQNYVDAANTAQDTANKEQVSTVIHASTAAICFAAASSFGTLESVCSAASVVGTVNDTMASKNIASTAIQLGSLKDVDLSKTWTGLKGLMSSASPAAGAAPGAAAGGAGAADAASSGASAGATAGAAPAAGADVASAGTTTAASTDAGATAAGQSTSGSGNSGNSLARAIQESLFAVIHGSAARDSQSTADQNRATANSLIANAAGGTTFAGSTAAASAANSATPSGVGGNKVQSVGDGRGNGNASPLSQACASATASGSMVGTIQCAMASDTTLPSAIASTQYLDALKKATGMEPDAFAKKVMSDGAGNTLGQLAGALGGSEAGNTVSGLIASAESQMGGAAGSYSGGGGRRTAGGGGEDPFAKTMQDMLAQLMPKKEGEEGANKGPNGLAFAKTGGRFPANVVEDRKVSLFERVTERYQTVTQRVLPDPKTQK